MALGFKLNALPEFQPGETVLHFKKWLWAGSCKSPPTYRLFFSLPPFCELALYVTDRRIVLLAHVFRLLTQQLSLWFPGKSGVEPPERFKAVAATRGHWPGSCLELISEDPQSHWYRSRELRLRLYMRDPETLRKLITEAAGKAR